MTVKAEDCMHQDPCQYISILNGRDVLFVMATEHEYGSHLRSRISPLICGVGPVEAATATAAVLCRLAHLGRLPHLVVTLGSAGSRRLDHAQVYQVASVCYRDMDATALGFERGITPFLNQPSTIPIPQQIAGIPAASLATGASVVSGEGYTEIVADMVDMETYAILRAAQTFDVSTISLRGISDGCSCVTHLSDWTEYLSLIDERLANTLDVFDVQLRNGTFTL